MSYDFWNQLELNLHRRAFSAEWTKHVDSVVAKGSALYFVRRSTRTPRALVSTRSVRKCSKQGITPTPKDAAGVSLSWWRGGRASRKLFSWKLLPHSLASRAGRQGGGKKIAGIHYTDGGDHAKRMKYTAWRAVVEASTSVDQLALQVRELDANIRWNNIDLLANTGRESKKPMKAFKHAVIRRRRQEGEVAKYLVDFGRTRILPDIVVRHGSLLEDSSNNRKKYWLAESHVPLHLLKAYEEKRIARASKRDISEELHKSSEEMITPSKKKGFEYLFQRAQRLEKSNCAHCNEDVLVREAVSCQYCNGLFHKTHAKECAASSSAECMYTCHKCWDKTGNAPLDAPVQRSRRNTERSFKLCLRTQRRRGKQAEPEREWWMKDIPKEKRAATHSCYWLNGLHVSKRRDDERLIQFRSKMLLLLSGGDAPIDLKPKCNLCGELEHTPNLNYVACEICGVWFHGDALDIKGDKIQSLIGFNCHNCLNKRPLVCPHQR